MPEQPPQSLSHAQSLREDALRRLSRSPHPYHKQKFELSHASERFGPNAPPTRSPLRSTQNTDDEEHDGQRRSPERQRESTNSDSGTEADDEHCLKGLPAPKLRPHKGLRGLDGSVSDTSSPLLTPAIIDEVIGGSRKTSISYDSLTEEDVWRVVEAFRQKQKAEIVRRVIEGGILVFVGSILCFNPETRELLLLWKRELICQILVITFLLAVYPLRLLRHINPERPWKRPLPLAIPAGFDPAPLLYPPAITILVSMLLFVKNPTGFLPGIILSLSSLPRELIPSIGGLDGSNTLHWAFSCLPLFAAETADTASIRAARNQQLIKLDPEVLVLIPPLHQALCVTLHYLTTTSLLPAELQLLSIALIDLLLLASSPQAVILKALLWGGGLGVLVTCVHVLRWGVALARVPKWRFRRTRNSSKPLRARKCLSFGRFGASLFARNVAVSDSSDEEDVLEASRQQHISSARRLSTKDIGRGENEVFENGAISAIDNPPGGSFSWTQRRHTLPTMTNLPARSSQNTPSGRKKRSTSSSIQSFFHLTQSQATVRKWLYAGYVYAWVLVIIFVGIRDYIQKFALQENEPIGWALGYLLGDISWFRMEVVTANLQRWICLPARSGLENEESCHLGWVEHLRHASFGEANTRLIISGYWLAIIIVGLAIVFRLSTIYEVDTRRKVFHFMMVAMLLPATYVDPTFAALALSLVLSIFLLLDLFRASQLPPLSKSLAYFLTPYVDGRDLKGPVVISHIFLLIGCAIPLWLSLGSLPRIGQNYLAGWEVPTREVSMVSGVICVGMGDAAASLIGRRYGRRKWLWRGGKSIEGSIAFATAVGLALGLAKAWLRIGGWPANNDDSWVMTAWKAGVAAGVASLTEAVLTGGNDNVIVPVVLWLCVKGLDI